jgi:alpha-galactosidase
MRILCWLSRRVRNEFAGRIAGAALLGLWMSFGVALDYTIGAMKPADGSETNPLPTANAIFLKDEMGAEGFPPDSAWELAPAIWFDADWRGLQADPGRSTEVRLLWNHETLFLKFRAHFRELHVFSDARPDGWRDELWERDVAEAFLQPGDRDPLVYKELEVSPNGYWIDLNISHGEKTEMRSGLRRRVAINEREHIWTAELAVPMRSLTPSFDPAKDWRVNFYRVEGTKEPRFYSAWSPTMTPAPNFHVPAAFGHLVFRDTR